MRRVIEIVFEESSGGAIKMAKNYKNDVIGSAVSIGIIKDNGEEPTEEEIKEELERFNAEYQKKMAEGKPIGGNAGEVVCLPFMLDVGDIGQPVDSDTRKNIINTMYSIRDLTETPDFEIRDVFELYKGELDKLKKFAENGESFRVWYDDAPGSMCGFYFVCDFLKNYECRISVIQMPLYIADDRLRVTTQFSSWGEVEPHQFYKFLPFEREIPDTYVKYLAGRWNELKEDNSPLRAVINGELTGVSEDFYDNIIRKELLKTDSEFKIGKLIGDILGKYKFNIGDFIYAWRIRKMIENGEIVIIDNGDGQYLYSATAAVVR